MKKDLEDYRRGALGSLMDEYERALGDLKLVLRDICETDYKSVIEGESDHCCSIEVIVNHVLRAGYSYAKYIRDALSMDALPVEDKKYAKSDIEREIDRMLAYTCEIFEGRWQTMDAQVENTYFVTRWEVRYNIDQLLEHAIVHILRHRRQIERFLLILPKLKNRSEIL